MNKERSIILFACLFFFMLQFSLFAEDGQVATPSIPADVNPPVLSGLSSSSHPSQNIWYTGDKVVLSWQGTDAEGSPVIYNYSLDKPGAKAALDKSTKSNNVEIKVPDGKWNFNLQGVDEAKNKSDVEIYVLQIDTQPPPGVGQAETYVNEQRVSRLKSGAIQNLSDRPFFVWQGSPDNASGTDRYLIYWGEDPQGVPDRSVSTGEFSPDEPITSNIKHYLIIKAVDKAGNSSEAQTAFVFEYDGLPPQKIDVLNARAVPTLNQAIISWDKPAEEDIKGYNIYRKVKGRDFIKLNSNLLNADTTEYIDTTMQRGVNYRYAVEVIDMVGNESGYSLEAIVPYLSLTKREQKVTREWDSGDTAVPGATITYTNYFANVGFSDVVDFVVQDSIPDNTTYEYESAASSLPVKIFYWNKELNNKKGGWTEKEPKKTSSVKKIKWVFKEPIKPIEDLEGNSGWIRFSVKIDYI